MIFLTTAKGRPLLRWFNSIFKFFFVKIIKTLKFCIFGKKIAKNEEKESAVDAKVAGESVSSLKEAMWRNKANFNQVFDIFLDMSGTYGTLA